MAATTIERDSKFAGLLPAKGTLSAAAATKFLKGTFVVRDANGRAAAPGAGLHAHGVAIATQDNTDGAADAMEIEISYGVHGFLYDGTAPKAGEVVYILDNQTVTLTAGTNGFAGIVTEVRGTYVWVWVNPVISKLCTDLIV
jgi:hypothetical protein